MFSPLIANWFWVCFFKTHKYTTNEVLQAYVATIATNFHGHFYSRPHLTTVPQIDLICFNCRLMLLFIQSMLFSSSVMWYWIAWWVAVRLCFGSYLYLNFASWPTRMYYFLPAVPFLSNNILYSVDGYICRFPMDRPCLYFDVVCWIYIPYVFSFLWFSSLHRLVSLWSLTMSNLCL